MAADRIVIIGAGLAGLRAAERLRERGHNGPIEIIGDEIHRPYTRPPLSKQVLSGKLEPADLTLRTLGADLDAIWTLGDGVARLTPGTRTINLVSGRHVRYDALIIASGVEARTLPDAPTHLPNVQTLRTLADCRAIDQAMTRADSIAIIGGGFIGCEVATSARHRALTTTIIDISPTLLGHAVGTEVGHIVTGIHRKEASTFVSAATSKPSNNTTAHSSCASMTATSSTPTSSSSVSAPDHAWSSSAASASTSPMVCCAPRPAT